MERMGPKKRNAGKRLVEAVMTLGCLFTLFFSSPAAAQCETGFTATAVFNQLIQQIVIDTNKFIIQETNWLRDKIIYTASYEIQERFEEFDENIRDGLSVWWRDHFEPSMKLMTQQLHVQTVDKQRQVGSLMDSKIMGEHVQDLQQRESEAVERYMPNELSCQVDSVGQGQVKTEQMSRALTSAYAKEEVARTGNTVGTPAAQGAMAEQGYLWNEYVNYFCDFAKGGQGCTGPTPLAGQHVDLPALLWGERRSISMLSADNWKLIPAAMRYFIQPRAPDPILLPESDPIAQRSLMQRRVWQARLNTVYNVVGRMLTQRIGGSGVDTSYMRQAAGVTDASVLSNDASYYDLKTAMMKDRFQNPKYVTQMINNPAQLVREQGSINALRMQQMLDIYKRMEEVIFMEAAVYASHLDLFLLSMPEASAAR